MIGKRNLGKAVVLGLLLSTGMYGAALAADEQEIRDERIWEPNVNVQLENKDLIIRDDKTAVGFNGTIDIKNGDLIIEASGASSNGIESGYLSDKAELQIYADNIDITSGANGMYTVLGDGGKGGNIILGSEDRKIQGLTIESGGQGIDNKNGNVYIYGTDDSQFYIHSLNTSGKNSNQAAINNSAYKGEISMTGGSIRLQTDKVDKGYGDGITNSTGTTTLNFNSIEMDVTGNGICNTSGTVSLNTESSNAITSDQRGIYNTSSGTVYLNTKGSNTITSAQQGIYAQKGTVDMTGASNSIEAGHLIQDEEDKKIWYGTDLAINAGSKAIFGNNTYAGIVNLKASDGDNTLRGAVYAIGDETNVQISGLADENRNYGNSRYNYVGSAAVIENAGGLKGKEIDSVTGETTGMDVVSALYAEEGAQINLSGITNTIRTYYADPTDEHTSERVVWAYKGAKINIDGATHISTYNYDQSPNSGDIAIAAGTATELKAEDFTEDKLNSLEKATVHLNYKAGSSIEGDILAAYGGEVTISNATLKTRAAGEDASFDGINIHGNLLAGNTGVLNVNLGNGGRLEGRADDYGDAGTEGLDSQHTSFFNPAFSSEILTGGEVNLTMGEGSTWEVTGQSWITKVDTGTSEHVEIDLVSANSNLNEKAQALTIGEMKGNAMFTMQLDGERNVSDMLYMKKANGEYFINLKNAVTVEDMYQDGFDGLRFATVGKGSNATFSAGTYDDGVYNVEYEVGTDNYNGNSENDAYNSTNADGNMDEAKPGNDLVDNFFKDEPQEAAANGVMTLAVVASPDSTDATEDMGTNTGMNGADLDDTTNFKLIGVKSTELSDAGKTVVAMSKVNYANAIYMDRLNKRMGEARYIDGDEGLWVRIRHDRIGKSDAFRSKNTMFELGYDRKVGDREDGEHRQGVVFDYMRGTADYDNVAGDGDVRRGGVWFYDTWLGDKGHYSDYVLKIGRLSNDFEVYARSSGEKITGDYSNFVYSASAEYGRKKDLGNNWYIEPQAQIQYAHVTDADYTTSQDTHVQLDAIDSLIGRVGFRLGKDVGEKSTFYIKADVLHEFLGDQDIEARDATGLLSTTYEN